MQTEDLSVTAVKQTAAGAFDLPSVIWIVRRRWRFLTFATIGVGLLALALSFTLRPIYKATTIVLPPDKSSSALSLLGGGSGASSSVGSGAIAALTMKSPADLYVALMTGPGVEDSVVKQLGLQQLYKVKHASEARKNLEQNLQVTADAKSGLITISARDHDPERAAAIANSIVQAFDKASAGLAITDAQRRRLFLEKQIAQTKLDLTHAEETLKTTSQQTGMLDPESDTRSMISFEANLRAQIALKTVQLASMKGSMAEGNPDLQNAERELTSLQAQADALSSKGSGTAFSSRKDQTESTLEYLRRSRDLRSQEALYELLLKNLEVAKLDEAREGTVIQVVDPATPPDMKDGPHRSFFLIGGAFLGFLLSAVWAVLQEGFIIQGFDV